MHHQIKSLHNLVTRRGSSKVLTFSLPQVFIALRLFYENQFVSRSSLCRELKLGEGSVKTLLTHLKEYGLVSSVRAGSFFTPKGKAFSKKFFDVTPLECKVPKSNLFEGQYNYAILLKDYYLAISNGMQQRDYAVMYGAIGAISLVFKDGKFIFPGGSSLGLEDHKINDYLIENLSPKQGDLVIISSASDPHVAKISAVNSALWTMASHESHS